MGVIVDKRLPTINGLFYKFYPKTLTKKRLLILGGSSEATALLQLASSIPHLDIILSLAGRTAHPVIPAFNTRLGGFGGVEGLITYLKEQSIDLVVDATHPFAAQISENAAQATRLLGIPHLLLERPPWEKQESDRWLEVSSHEAAAALLPNLSTRVFLTIGRLELGKYAHLQDICFLMRMIDPPNPPLPPGEILLDRGPFSLETERLLLNQYHIGALVSKNSGGAATYGKIIAARELGIPVVMIERPAIPAVIRVSEVETAIAWLLEKAQ